MSLAFSVPPAAKECLALICQLRGAERESSFAGLTAILASANYSLMSALWEGLARQLGLTITDDDKPPQAGARRESCDPLTSRIAWRL